MRDALPELDLQGRIGVMTGEVVTGTAERLVTGDAVNVAARLEQAAEPGTVLIGQPTHSLIRDAVEVEARDPLALKGKAEPVAAFRLLRVLEDPGRRHDTRFVGRTRELALVRDAWEQAQHTRSCVLVTVIGDAGVGKSRLVAESLISVEATIVRGRCLPYGEGITYWPVVEILKQLDVLPQDEVAASAIRSLLGESETPTSAEEIAWAVRKTLEHAAATRPVVVVFDDIQWGEQTLHDLIEHVALLSTGAPILLLCIARPELSEHNPDWPVSVRLSPLDDDDVDALIPIEIAGDLRVRIARAAGGNPLYVTEMLAMADETQGDVIVPPTLHALLAARLDQLEPMERRVLELASIEGEVFHRGAIQALAQGETPITPRLAALVRKQLILHDRSTVAGDDGFRFRHLLLRDAAYDGLPKASRADLHERYAGWLERSGADIVELDELLGYHLEQACRYRTELGLPDDGIAVAAQRRLTTAGHRAVRRQDYAAAIELFGRVIALTPEDRIDFSTEILLIDALYWKGAGDEGLRRAEALTERGAEAGDDVARLSGEILSGYLRLTLEPVAGAGPLSALVERTLPALEAAGSDVGLFAAYQALAWAEFIRARLDPAFAAFENAAGYAARAGLPQELLGWRALCVANGSTPNTRALQWFEVNEPRTGRDYWFRAAHAITLTMMTRVDEGRAILADTRAELAERGGGITLATLTGIESAMVELLAGDPEAAVALAAEGCRLLEALDDVGFLSSAAATHAEALYDVGRIDDAAFWAERSAALGASDDAFSQVAWRTTHARVLATRGDLVEAEGVARKAVSIAEATDWLVGQGDAQLALADVLLMGGRRDEAAEALEEAIQRYERKGNLVSETRARTLLVDVRKAQPT